MATQVQWRRGTHAQVAAFTGAVGEMVIDTTQNRAVVQDGVTMGGWPQALLIDIEEGLQTWKSAGGSANAITLTSLNPVTALVAGTQAQFLAPNASTSTAVTVKLDGTAVTTLRKNNAALAVGDIQAGLVYWLTYDGTYWQIQAGGFQGNTTGAVNELQGASVASASSVELGSVTGNRIDITGTTTITGFTWTGAQIGAARCVRFTGALTLTYNASSLILPTALNITTVAGDFAILRNLGSGNTECEFYQRASGQALASLTSANVQVFTNSGTFTPPGSYSIALVICIGGGGGGGAGTATNHSGAGGAGGYRAVGVFRASDIGVSQTVTVGAGGAGGTTSGSAGSTGNNTTFGTLLTGYGGGPGAGNAGNGGGGGGSNAVGVTGTGGFLGGGTNSRATTEGGGGAGGNGTSAGAANGFDAAYGGAGGGGGAGNGSATAGGNGGASTYGTSGAGGTTAGTAGSTGGAAFSLWYGGGGGGGGGSNSTNVAGNGGTGGGSGGGGGGGAGGGSVFGQGGTGGAGICVVLTW